MQFSIIILQHNKCSIIILLLHIKYCYYYILTRTCCIHIHNPKHWYNLAQANNQWVSQTQTNISKLLSSTSLPLDYLLLKNPEMGQSVDGNHLLGVELNVVVHTVHYYLNSKTNMEIAGSFHDIILSSTRFSLSSSQCSSIQRSPPTRSGANRVQCIQGGCATSPYSSLRRVSVLSCSCCLFCLISPCLVFGLFPSHVMESHVSQQPLRISRAMHASLA